MILEISNFGRVQLADLLHELNAKVAVEVGVAEGWYSDVLMRANPQMKLYGVDPFEPYRGYHDYTRQNTFDRLEDNAQARLKRHANYKFIRKYSIDAVKNFKNNSLDFVYIDGNHAEPWISEDINNWYQKVRHGGILAGHDWVSAENVDVKQATIKFAKENNLILFILGVSAIDKGIRDRPRSWLIIKR